MLLRLILYLWLKTHKHRHIVDSTKHRIRRRVIFYLTTTFIWGIQMADSAVINRPHLSWIQLQELANKYGVRITAAGKKLLLRATPEDLVRMLSAIRILQG